MPRAIPSAEIVAKILCQKGLSAGVQRGRVLALWPEVAGPALSEFSEAERLEDGVLFVRVPDVVVAHQLTYLREEFVRRYQEKQPGLVRELRFLVGFERKARPPSRPEVLPKLDSEEEARLQRLAERSPQELREVILRAGRAVLRRQKGNPHPPCPVCARPSPEHPCKPCQGLLAAPAVQREARRLTRFPLRTSLEGEPLQAARYLAQQRLEAQLHDLLPQAIRQPELLPILQDTARRYLQLRTGERVVGAYRHLLPEALSSLLKGV
jgi:predicted nucleic acid-binding Zn ribbon protein